MSLSRKVKRRGPSPADESAPWNEDHPSRADKRQPGNILQISDLFACQNKILLVESMDSEPILAVDRLDLRGKTILFFASRDYDRNAKFAGADVGASKLMDWVVFKLFLKRVPLPVDLIILDRVDEWNPTMTKKKKGAIRSAIIQSMVPKVLKGTNVIITSMGNDVGLRENCHEVFDASLSIKQQ